MNFADKILILLGAVFLGLVFVLLQTYDFAKPIIDMILTVTAVVSFVIALVEFLKKK